MQCLSPPVFKPSNQSANMRKFSSNSSSSTSSSPAVHSSRIGATGLSVSAVLPIRAPISRASSSESSVGSPSDPTPRQRTKKRPVQLVFPYAPSVVPHVSSSSVLSPFDLDSETTSLPAIQDRIRSRTSKINAGLSGPQRRYASTPPNPPPRLVNRRRQVPRMVCQ